MIHLKINVRNLSETREVFDKLPKKIKKEIEGDALDEISTKLKRMIKRRVPVKTGWTRYSVMIEKPTANSRIVMINSFYAMAIEKGRKSSMFIPLQFITQHLSMPDAPGRRVMNPIWINLSNTKAAKPRPFIAPSLDAIKQKVPEIVQKHFERAITK